MKAKNQRLTLILVAMVAMICAALLAMSALKDEAAYFRSPGDLLLEKPEPGKAFRLGGMVKAGSIQREADGVTIRFIATDGKAETSVRYTGIVPDLFKENSGMVADGRLSADNVFVADTILAKHDERYMPPQLDGTMHKTGSVS